MTSLKKIIDWYKKKINKEDFEFDDYDQYVCQVIFWYLKDNKDEKS